MLLELATQEVIGSIFVEIIFQEHVQAFGNNDSLLLVYFCTLRVVLEEVVDDRDV